TETKAVAAGCLPGGGFKYLDVNNIRTRINTGGDMWWDFESAQYEIPKGSGKMSMFAASLWIGGLDVNGQLKLAALRYRQVGNDYWPGPLAIDGTASVDAVACAKYDKHFPMTRPEVNAFLAWYDDKGAYPGYTIPTSIMEWPAHGDVSKKQSYYLAPFYDRDGDGVYDPFAGDYPYYDLKGDLCRSLTPTMDAAYYYPNDPDNWKYGILSDQVIKGDQTLWWVFNDKGNIHTETKGAAIGLEIRGQAFGFGTNDEINNMTFYSYEIINRSTFTLQETYFSQWVDPDLGYAYDDYIGCDVKRGLGYCYNGLPADGLGQAWAYGNQPPAIGVDFFQGPYMDPIAPGEPYYNKDLPSAYDVAGNLKNCEEIKAAFPTAINGVNFGDGIANNERFGMRRFTYFNNSTGLPAFMTDPVVAIDYYNYLRGIWKDGTKMIYGGLGHPLTGGFGPPTDFLFPGDSDPCFWGTNFIPVSPAYWTEETSNNPANDRRFLQSAGPFTLKPGAVNYITVGIPWARATAGGPFASVELLRVTDDKCQAMFDNCFQVVNGPNAPDLTFRELDQELIVYISNRKWNDAGNNFNEEYSEFDYNIPDFFLKKTTILKPIRPGSDTMVVTIKTDTVRYDRYYKFEGYQIYQLKSASVSVGDIRNPDLSRLVFQCDVKNNVTTLINHLYDQSLAASVPRLEVIGRNEGINHSFKVTLDAFTNQALVNHKQYYYLALAYGHNQYEKYTADPQAQEPGVQSLYGQKKVFLSGRNNIKNYTAIPHKIVGSINAKSKYGDGVEITRIQGQGNGGNLLDLTKATIDLIMSKPPADSLMFVGHPNYPIAYQPTYKKGRGPLTIKVIDPLNVKKGSFTVRFDSMYWQKKHRITSSSTIIPGGDTAGMMVSTWKLIDNTTKQVIRSSKSIFFENEQLFLEQGFSITMKQVFQPGPHEVGKTWDGTVQNAVWEIIADNNSFIESSIIYADSSKQWLRGVPNIDGGGPFNWIRSGTTYDRDNVLANTDWDMKAVGAVSKPFDPNAVFEKVIEVELVELGGVKGGSWTPFQMAAYEGQDALARSELVPGVLNKNFNLMRDLASVDIVLTPDKSKWTRAVVIELCAVLSLSQNNTAKFAVRNAPSVDKNGTPAAIGALRSNNPDDPNYLYPTGMGWFPGYAINIETGERLNIMFGENSSLITENGRDMKWNPTSRGWRDDGSIVFGGMHYVYVMSSKTIATAAPGLNRNAPAYDAGRYLRWYLEKGSVVVKRLIWATAMWVNIPLAVPNQQWLSNEAIIRIRIAKPYARDYSNRPTDAQYLASDTVNRNWPMYTFSTDSIATLKNDFVKAQTELDIISVVPNPYYAYNSYETNQLDNRVKIINLPSKCTVSIYSVGGTLIRQFTKDSQFIADAGGNELTSIDWDLKNYAGIPISGGLYIIHVKADGIGEKTVKWFGALRPIDLNSF
ncbi:MAG: hypothetical protein Q8M23_06905, partial [Bacteroidales bacterium]|nr:hypothetical protein [Bacteroidales bacterium]